MALAVANYHDAYDCFPPPYLADENGAPMHSWRVLLLPFLDGQKLHKQYRFDEPWNGPNNSKLHSQMPRVFKFSPKRDISTTMTNYLAVVGPNTVWPETGNVSYRDITDGPDETIQFVECTDSGIHWMEPRDLHFDTMTMSIDTDPKNGISSWHEPPGVAMADGSLKQLPIDLPKARVRAMLILNDGAVSGDDVEPMEDGRKRPVKKDAARNASDKDDA